MQIKTLKNTQISGKRVLVRAGMDVPVDKEGNITNDKRIIEGLPTLKFLLDNNVKQIVILNHMGRPKSKDDKALTHNKLAEKLSSYLKVKVTKLDDCIGIEIPADKVVLLENVRFYKEETDNNDAFAKKLSEYGDIFVNDAFSVSHRNQASVTGIPKFLPSCAGLLLEKEITILGNALNIPQRPFVVILGGAKVSDKLGLIKNMLPKVDYILIGGAMMFTFYRAKGYNTGKSLVEENLIPEITPLLTNLKVKIPEDVVVADAMDAKSESRIVQACNIGDKMGLDIGPDSVMQYQRKLYLAKTIFWSGPLGAFEIDKFSYGTRDIARYIANNSKGKTTIIGGGDTAAAIEKFGLQDKFTHVSTGGGASLEFMEGKVLPGIKALEDNFNRFG